MNKLLVWKEGRRQELVGLRFRGDAETTDNDATGLVFYYRDAANHYRVVLDAETNTRSLVKVQNGVESVLASARGGTPWSRDFQLKVVAIDGTISAFLDGHSLFGEVVDAAPLAGGSVGFYSHNQRSSQFDNVTVNKVTLTAHAGDDLRPFDAMATVGSPSRSMRAAATASATSSPMSGRTPTARSWRRANGPK